jgi:myo-inositol-1(or 4)-monophosphatase
MTTDIDRLDFAIDTARKAGALALKYFADLGSLTVKSKGVQDMATEADVNTEAVIRAAISKTFPDDAFLGEESSDTFSVTGAPGTWIVDPIDGTQPFICGIPTWCISIAYYAAGRTELGVIFDPSNEAMFAARRGGGASLNGVPIRVADVSSIGDGLVGVGYSTRVTPEATLEPLGRLLHANGMYHRCGSGALSLAYVAAGRLIGYFEPHMCAWDMAAGELLVLEAGGKSNNCLPNDRALIDGNLIVAGAGGIYDELCAIVDGDA